MLITTIVIELILSYDMSYEVEIFNYDLDIELIMYAYT